jgi:hypothetical protein
VPDAQGVFECLFDRDVEPEIDAAGDKTDGKRNSTVLGSNVKVIKATTRRVRNLAPMTLRLRS